MSLPNLSQYCKRLAALPTIKEVCAIEGISLAIYK